MKKFEKIEKKNDDINEISGECIQYNDFKQNFRKTWNNVKELVFNENLKSG